MEKKAEIALLRSQLNSLPKQVKLLGELVTVEEELAKIDPTHNPERYADSLRRTSEELVRVKSRLEELEASSEMR
jgi:hypothetical protein